MFPVLMAFALFLAQSAMLMAGNLYVHYAAAAAARSAAVQVPRDDGLEPRNLVYTGDGSAKFDAIRSAAVVAVLPAAGRLDDGATHYDRVPDGLRAYFDDAGRDTPAWADTRVLEELRYADRHTRLSLARVDGDGAFTPIAGGSIARFAPRESFGVVVTHRLHLGVPYASALFADGTHDTLTGESAYTRVTARAVTVNRGVNPDLPDRPRNPVTGDEVPRQP